MTWVSVGLLLLLLQVVAQDFGEQCLAKFKRGREDFILDADDSVKDGATFIASPKVGRYRDCVVSCCKDPRCNVAFMERGSEEGLIGSCFLFDCLYKKKYVCRFVRKKGYINYILDSVYESDLAVEEHHNEDDRPPVANAGQDRVVQPQDNLILNGIASKDDHKVVSYKWQMVSGNSFVIMEKTNLDDQVIVSNLTSGMYRFQLTVTDSSGQSDSTQISVLVLTPEQSEHHCMAPAKPGPCRGSFPRWHYNAASEKCEEFIFGGCRENLNNYLSLLECTNACYGSEKNEKSSRGLPIPAPNGEKCGAPCTADQFSCSNGCCLDPGLECDKVKQCSDGSDEENCDDLDKKFRILLQIPVDVQKVRCTEHPDTGNCRDSITKWYYNPLLKNCFRFNYGGCHGNENKFDTEESCMKSCKDVTGILVIAALLGLAILILLGVLCYCFLKGKKRQSQHHHVPVNGSQAATMEDRERLVYNSTTKPI
ncbi:kunitz-type protease inhibitor 1a [Diretmus argenteus]